MTGASSFTVTTHVAVFPPVLVVTVMTAVPADTAVTTPFELTVATSLLLLDQETVLSEAFSGRTVALRASVSFTDNSSSLLFSSTPVTATGVESMTISSGPKVLIFFLSTT